MTDTTNISDLPAQQGTNITLEMREKQERTIPTTNQPQGAPRSIPHHGGAPQQAPPRMQMPAADGGTDGGTDGGGSGAGEARAAGSTRGGEVGGSAGGSAEGEGSRSAWWIGNWWQQHRRGKAGAIAGGIRRPSGAKAQAHRSR